MEVRHEAPIPDTLFRVTAPLIVGFGDGTWLRVNQWNLRGLYDARLAECTLDEVMLSVPFQGVGIFFEVTLVPGEGTDEFLFRDLTGRQRETLALFYRNLLSGRMAVTDEIITSLDTPVDLVPMEETEIEKQLGKAARAPRPLRAAASILVYVLIFVLVFSYLGSLALDRLSTLHAPMAFVTGQPNNPQGQPVIRARLTPDHVTDVWVGMQATILFNKDGQLEDLTAYVGRIDFVGPETEPGMILTLLPVTAPGAFPLRDGTPVQVDLNRQLLRRALGLPVGALVEPTGSNG
jgi:hypothetical protein